MANEMEITGPVLCCGNVVFDIQVSPVEDVDWNKTRWVESIAENIGGNGANTSYTLARMGVPVTLVSLVGDDERGERLLSILRTAGVDTSSVSALPGAPTSATVVLVRETGDRKFYHRPGASREMVASSVVFDGRFRHFHLANPFALPRLRGEAGSVMVSAKRAGLTTSIDTGWDSLGRWMEDLGSCLPHTDLLFVNDGEEAMLGGMDNLRAHGASVVVVKTGPKGCRVHEGTSSVEVPGFAIQAVDSTGAGDCFAGAFLAAMHRGFSLTEAARFANAAGAMNVEKLGAVTGIGTWEETTARMNA